MPEKTDLIKLNDYLYDGNTVRKILHEYAGDLKESASVTKNPVDQLHADFLYHYIDLLEHNEFLTSQSQRLLKFYKYLTGKYPFLAFTFRGRIKSLVRTEEKYNGYILQQIYHARKHNLAEPTISQMSEILLHFRDLIAYRYVIEFPVCHLKPGQSKQEIEKQYLYEIANALPGFLQKYGFIAQPSGKQQDLSHSPLSEEARSYYRDYLLYPKSTGYQSLHITYFDTEAKIYFEIQLRTKAMDDQAEIGNANHMLYEEYQENRRARRALVPPGSNQYFDEACERENALRDLDLTKVWVNMFTALNSQVMNDACGFYRGRFILPYEHLSRFQNDIISLPEKKE